MSGPAVIFSFMFRPLRRRQIPAVVALAATAFAGRLPAQAAIDPNVAPRAAELERAGDRRSAIDLLGHYLATAPDDGRAWFQLGRLYLYSARDWHRQGHNGDPDGWLFLDFAETALEQSARLSVDSGVVYGGLAELERGVMLAEDSGWAAALRSRVRPPATPLPPYVVELGDNLLRSCPAGGVLLTGGDLEALSVWYGSTDPAAMTIIPLRPDLYATDSVYRARMASAMGTDPSLPVKGALDGVAARRPLCLSPEADSAAAPPLAWRAFRLVRIGGAVDLPPGAPGDRMDAAGLSTIELIAASRGDPSPWVRDVRTVYERAAAYNSLLCRTLRPVGDSPPPACR